MLYIPEPYQAHATKHIMLHRGTGLFMEMGLGKTVATLTAEVDMRRGKGVKRTLVIAPLAVAKDTWSDEIEKWDHTKHLRVSKILGTASERTRAAMKEADIYTINCENVPWLVAQFQGEWRWDRLVVDESSKFKSAKSRRFKSLRMVLSKFNSVTCLTGTPRPNSLLDLWSQLYLIDGGERLGKTLGLYRTTYFKPAQTNGHIIYSYTIKKEAKESLLGEEIYAREIYDKIADVCISMKAEDYLKLPERIIRTREISLSAEAMAKYKAFEEEMVMEMADKEITAANAAVLTGKLLQFAGGAVYDSDKIWHQVHEEKLDALEDIVDDAQGEPVLIFYNYKHEYERICKRLKGYKPRLLATQEDRLAWNRGEIPVAIGHAKSIGHGLNLQAGGSVIVWFGPQWSLELNDQAIARLLRRGQQAAAVIVHYLIVKGTMDVDAMRSLANKREGQNGAMKALKARMNYYGVAA